MLSMVGVSNRFLLEFEAENRVAKYIAFKR